jgi:hypothetical protein
MAVEENNLGPEDLEKLKAALQGLEARIELIKKVREN